MLAQYVFSRRATQCNEGSLIYINNLKQELFCKYQT